MKSRFVVALMLLGFTAERSSAGFTVFDNGSFSGDQIGRFNMDPFTMTEDFTLTATHTITGFKWTQHDADQSMTYFSTTLAVYNGFPSLGTQIFSGDIVATRTANANGVLFGSYIGYDYEITGLSLVLGPGTHYFSIYNNVSGGGWTWDQTTGTSQTIPGRWQDDDSDPDPGEFFADENSAFQVIASDITAVPAPPAGILLAIGAVGLAGGRALRRRITPAAV